MIPKNVTREDFLESVKQGVKEAILTMTESGDGHSGPIIREPFLDHVKKGVECAMEHGELFKNLPHLVSSNH